MEITSIQQNGYSVQEPATLKPDQAADRRKLLKAVKSVNDSGVLGNNELVFSVDRQTHRPVIRVEDKDTHEVLFQEPPEYVLSLAQSLNGGSTQG
jgi:uncharacterized FlaG/YvyC family protein